jgi:hypothetical protein
MGSTVVFLGAGATKSCGGPLTNEILHEIVSTADPSSQLPLLQEFLKNLFHVDVGLSKEHYPGLPLVMSLVDTALDRREAFHPKWNTQKLSEIREAVELGIFDHLEERLNKVPTTNHYSLLQTIFPTTEPCVISTNYDLLIDTAMMFRSQASTIPNGPNGDGGLPDYHCSIQSDFYRNIPHFGTLLKLHGSVNWLYCSTCHALVLGASESAKFLKVLASVVGPTLKQSYTADGSICTFCNTTKLRPLLIAPSHLKDYRNPHLTQVWYEAERLLRQAERIIFIGYSLPEDDVEVIYLLKRGLTRDVGKPPVAVTVVEYDPKNPGLRDHAVGRRYRALFGDSIDWHPEGLDAWLAQKQAATASVGS